MSFLPSCHSPKESSRYPQKTAKILHKLPPGSLPVMSDLTNQLTATIVFSYAWSICEGTKQTLNYTKTYTNTPGLHSLNHVVANTALPSPAQFETVGFSFLLKSPGGQVTQSALATIATFRPSHVRATATATALTLSTAANMSHFAEAQTQDVATNSLPLPPWRPCDPSYFIMTSIVLLIVLKTLRFARLWGARIKSSHSDQSKC